MTGAPDKFHAALLLPLLIVMAHADNKPLATSGLLNMYRHARALLHT
jgi:hypothetical protein